MRSYLVAHLSDYRVGKSLLELDDDVINICVSDSASIDGYRRPESEQPSVNRDMDLFSECAEKRIIEIVQRLFQFIGIEGHATS